MRRLIIFIIVLALGTCLGIKISNDAGYVFIAYRQWTIETTLWFALFSLIIIVFAVLAIYNLLKSLLRTNKRINHWRKKRRRRRARYLANQGLRLLAEGQWQKAENALLRRVEDSEVPFLNYIAAAFAAQAQGKYKTRDEDLRQAGLLNTASALAVTLSQAQLQMQAGQYEEAAATLYHIHKKYPQHVHALALLKDAYVALKDWASLFELLPVLLKRNVLSVEQYNELEYQTYSNLMEQKLEEKQFQELDELWRKLPKRLHSDPRLTAIYVDSLTVQNRNRQALQLITEILKKQWVGSLVQRFGQIEGPDLKKQLHTGENWLKIYDNQPKLLLTLGRLSAKLELWGKAKQYFESALQLSATATSYFELASILDQLGEYENAYYYYKAGLGKCCENTV